MIPRTPTGIVALALATATVVGADLTAVIPGVAATTRSALELDLHPAPGQLHEALDILTTNACVALQLLVAACAVSHVRTARRYLDLLLVLITVVNPLLVGAALGAYGLALIPRLAHLPAEWAALAVAAGAYLTARQGHEGDLRLPLRTGISIALFALAALTETYVTPWL